MVSYRYLGSALTNANGVATFDYQGTGVGEVDVIASTDNPITSSSIVSETYSIFDCVFVDTGLTENTNWYGRQALSHDIQADGHLLTNTGTGVVNYLANDPSTAGRGWADTFDWDNCEWKFEIVSYTGTVKYFNQNGATSEITSTGEFTVTNDSSTKRQAGLQLGAGATVKYKNFRIYPI